MKSGGGFRSSGRLDYGPVEIRAPKDWQTAKRGAQLVYADGTILTHVKGKGVSFYGTLGECHVNRGKFELIMDGKTVHKFWDKEVDKTTSMEREVVLTEREFLADAKIKLTAPKSHLQNFLDCVQSRQTPIADVAIGASSVIACHLMNFAYHYGANAKWNPERNKFASGGNSKWKKCEVLCARPTSAMVRASSRRVWAG